MKIVFDTKNNVESVSGLECLLNSGGRLLYIGGSVLGYIDCNTVLDQRATIKELINNIDLESSLIETLKGTVGSYYLVYKSGSHVKFYVSPKGPGFFYYENNGSLVVTDSDVEAARECLDSGMNQMELLHLIRPYESHSCSPFTTIMNGVRRIPGGMIAGLGNDRSLAGRFYITDESLKFKSDNERSYTAFKDIFESTCDMLCKNAKSHDIYSMFSAGIDSSVVTLAALKKRHNIIPIHSRKFNILTRAVTTMCNGMGVEPIYYGSNNGVYDPGKLNWKKAYKFYSNALTLQPILNMYLNMPDQCHSVMTGIGFGCVMQTNALMRPRFGEPWLFSLYSDYFKTAPYRYLFTRGFCDMVQRGTAPKYLSCASVFSGQNSWKAPKDISEYLFALTITNKLPLLPKKLLPTNLSGYTDKYLKYVGITHERIVGSVVNDCIGRSELSYDSIRRTMRAIRYACQIQMASLSHQSFTNIFGKELLEPPIEGPLISFFMEMPQEYDSVTKPKDYLMRYFEEEYGVSYHRLIRSIKKDLCKRVISRAVGKRTDNRVRLNNVLFNTSEYRDVYLEQLNVSNSKLLPMITDDGVGHYVESLYRDIHGGACRDVATISKMINLELYFKNISS